MKNLARSKNFDVYVFPTGNNIETIILFGQHLVKKKGQNIILL